LYGVEIGGANLNKKVAFERSFIEQHIPTPALGSSQVVWVCIHCFFLLQIFLCSYIYRLTVANAVNVFCLYPMWYKMIYKAQNIPYGV